MQLLIKFFIVLVVIAILASATQTLTGREIKLPKTVAKEKSQEPLSTRSGLASIIIPSKKLISIIDTYITSGPKGEENVVIFEFDSVASSGVDNESLVFETKLEGADKDWEETSSKIKTYILPSSEKEYTFWVRAKTDEIIDPTPAKRTFTVETPVSYSGKIEISNIVLADSTYPCIITLNTRIKKEEEINITGWYLEARGGKFTIPTGTDKYLPGNTSAPIKNIIIDKDDTIYLSCGSSPLGKNVNFRTNECMGYLKNKENNSGLSFPTYCPKPAKEDLYHLSSSCQSFIYNLRRCEVPNISNNPEIARDSKCVAFLNDTFNYEKCFVKHSKTDWFSSNHWYIFMNSNIVTNNTCDILYLKDSKGNIIDEYDYGPYFCD